MVCRSLYVDTEIYDLLVNSLNRVTVPSINGDRYGILPHGIIDHFSNTPIAANVHAHPDDL